MIGRDQQRVRLGKRAIVGEERHVDVTVRTDERETSRLLVQGARETPDRRIRVEVSVLVQHEAGARGWWRGAGPVRRYTHPDVSHVSTSRRPEPARISRARRGEGIASSHRGTDFARIENKIGISRYFRP